MDFIASSSTVRFPACETRRCVDVTIVDDLVRELFRESFAVYITRSPNMDRRITLNPAAVNVNIFITDNDT